MYGVTDIIRNKKAVVLFTIVFVIYLDTSNTENGGEKSRYGWANSCNMYYLNFSSEWRHYLDFYNFGVKAVWKPSSRLVE